MKSRSDYESKRMRELVLKIHGTLIRLESELGAFEPGCHAHECVMGMCDDIESLRSEMGIPEGW